MKKQQYYVYYLEMEKVKYADTHKSHEELEVVNSHMGNCGTKKCILQALQYYLTF